MHVSFKAADDGNDVDINLYTYTLSRLPKPTHERTQVCTPPFLPSWTVHNRVEGVAWKDMTYISEWQLGPSGHS